MSRLTRRNLLKAVAVAKDDISSAPLVADDQIINAVSIHITRIANRGAGIIASPHAVHREAIESVQTGELEDGGEGWRDAGFERFDAG